MKAIVLGVTFALAPAPLCAQLQQPIPSSASSAAAVQADIPPTIDGRADDAVWRTAPVTSDFRVWDPDEGAEPKHATDFQVAYDESNLYVFIRAWDSAPDSIMRSLTRRDVRGPSDMLLVYIDSYDDNRTGFQFIVNPDGVKMDAAVYDDGDEDTSWNGVWDVGTQVDSLGWTAEFMIPLSQLRYADADRHTFGFGVFRDIERYRERSAWPAISRNRQGIVSQLGRLEGLVGLTSARSIEATPYLVAKDDARATAASRFDRARTMSVGGDVKLRITPNVTLDGTINPDFGQVEADPAVLNLGTVETFVSERRPFFVEGTGTYRFELNCYIVVDCNTNEGLFYSRRIGRAPTLRGLYADPSSPAAAQIAVATKLTGRTAGGLSFGLLDAVTRRVETGDGRTLEPRTNYAVLSLEQDFNAGNAGIRVIGTAVNRSLDEWSERWMHSSAYTAGISGRARFFGGNYSAAASFAASSVHGSEEAIALTQRNGVHFFQQPDDGIEYDSLRTSLTGTSMHAKVGKYGGGHTRLETSFVRQSAGFDVNDLGYLQRADRQDWSTWTALVFNEPRTFYRWMQFNANHWQTWNTDGRRLEMAANVNGHVGLNGNWDLHAGATATALTESYCDRCTRGGPALRRSPGLHPWFGVNGDRRRMITPSLWVNLGYSDEGNTRTVSLSPSLMVRFSSRLQAQIGAGFSNNDFHAQWIGNFAQDGATHYTFAELSQETRSMNVRVNYTATPDLTLELYAAPFVSSGTYSNYRRVSDTPDAAALEDRFVSTTVPDGTPAGFNVRELRGNLVARWEYRPGSTLFLVWAHGRQDRANVTSDRGWLQEYDGLFDLYPQNTFMVKVAWWFNR